MEKVILSTAAFCLWNISPQEKLRICKELQFKQIAIALSTEKMARDFSGYSLGSIDITSFEKIAIHAPWRGISYGENSRTQRILDHLSLISKNIPVDVFVFRVDCIIDLMPIIRSGLPICLENSDKVGSWEKLKEIAGESNFPLALNVNRAIRGHDYMDEMIYEFGHRIERIQISGFNKKQGRMPIVLANQLYNLEKVKDMDALLVLEGLFEPGDTEGIINERQAVWRYLSS